MNELNHIQNEILNWATDKGIFESGTVNAQFFKLIEEAMELRMELISGNLERQKTEFGDVLVVLTILAQMLNTSFEECIYLAHEKNKNRTGKMFDGSFVKD
jgi:NTP pyrophosphatase (non-canonical NTP hydrolase)